MKKLLLLSLLLLLLVSCSQPQLAPPVLDDIDVQAKGESYRFGNHTAYAYFNSSDECSYTIVSIFATAQKSKGSKAGGTEPWADASVYHYDWCEDTYISAYGGTALAKGAFKVSGGLKSASLNTAINFSQWRCDYGEALDDWYCTEEPVGVIDINLNWTATGKTERYSYRYSEQYKSAGYMFKHRYYSQGASRNATASGNVTVSQGELNTTFTSWDYAWIGSSRVGSLYISK